MTITEKIQLAENNSRKSFYAVGGFPVSAGHASNLNVTIDGSSCVKHGKIIVPINIFYFSSFSDRKYNLIFDQKTVQFLERLSR